MSTIVLVIDDELLSATLSKTALESVGFQVIVAQSGVEGLEAARQENPDVILLDLMMPGVDGWEVCRTIRTFSQVPILVLSAVTDSDRVLRALDEGANDYLVKPAPPGVLISRVRKLAQQAGATPTNKPPNADN